MSQGVSLRAASRVSVVSTTTPEVDVHSLKHGGARLK